MVIFHSYINVYQRVHWKRTHSSCWLVASNCPNIFHPYLGWSAWNDQWTCPYCRYPHHIPTTRGNSYIPILKMKNTYLVPSTATFLLVKIGLILRVEGLLKPWFPHSFLNLAAYYPLVVGRFPCFWLVIHVVNPRKNVQLRKVYITQEMGDVDGGIGFTTFHPRACQASAASATAATLAAVVGGRVSSGNE